MRRKHVLGLSALAVAVVLASTTASATAAYLITGRQIKDYSITGVDIAPSTLTGTKILDSSLTGADVFNGSLTGADVKDGSLTLSDLSTSARVGGPAGPTGATGAQGSTGATGAAGVKGLNGLDGADGATGAAGARGATGAPGSTITTYTGTSGRQYPSLVAAVPAPADPGTWPLVFGVSLPANTYQDVAIKIDAPFNYNNSDGLNCAFFFDGQLVARGQHQFADPMNPWAFTDVAEHYSAGMIPVNAAFVGQVAPGVTAYAEPVSIQVRCFKGGLWETSVYVSLTAHVPQTLALDVASDPS